MVGGAPGTPVSAAYSPDGTMFAVGLSSAGQKSFVDLYDSNLKRILSIRKTAVIGEKLNLETVMREPGDTVAFSPGPIGVNIGNRLVVGGFRYLLFIDPADKEQITGLNLNTPTSNIDQIHQLAFVGGNPNLLVVRSGPNISILDLSNYKIVKDAGFHQPSVKFKFRVDSKQVLGQAQVMAVNNKGDRMIVVAGKTGFLYDLTKADPKAYNNPRRLQLLGSTRSVAFSPDNSTIAVGYDDGTVLFWDTKADPEDTIGPGVQVGKGQVHSLAFSADGKVLAVGNQDGSVTFVDTATQKILGNAPLPK